MCQYSFGSSGPPGHGLRRDVGMCVCSGNQSDSKPRASRRARQLVDADGVVGGEHRDAEVHGVVGYARLRAGQGDDRGRRRAAKQARASTAHLRTRSAVRDRRCIAASAQALSGLRYIVTTHAPPRPRLCWSATFASVDLALVGRAAELPVELGALREAGGAERVALRDQAARRVHDPLAAVGVRRRSRSSSPPLPSAGTGRAPRR